MSTKEIIQALNKLSFTRITALLSRGNVTLQKGNVFTAEDYDTLLGNLRDYKLGEY